uniref:Uncharacterized protein n=1 Tax=Tanacetum cinerariifolium TaxID=118510 RepID=A0A6L2LWE3_TANCI|nr:hypothetical protein [Tanacetum cinerariifolium]
MTVITATTTATFAPPPPPSHHDGACLVLINDLKGALDLADLPTKRVRVVFTARGERKSRGQVGWSRDQGIRLCLSCLTSRSMISIGSSIKLNLPSSRISFIGMTRDSSDRHFFRLEMWKVLWTLLSSSGSSSVYATGPTLLRILNGQMYRGLSFPLFSESDDTLLSLQALSNLHYLFGGFMNYLWSCELNISNFGPADSMIKSLQLPKSGNQLRFLIHRVPSRRTSNALSIPLDMIVPAFLKELICKVLGLLVPLLELNQFGILLGELGEGQIASGGWPFVSVVPGQMTHLVASMTLDSARSCVMQGAFLTQGKAFSILSVFIWGGSISPDGFLPSILLLGVIIVAVAIVVTVVLVVVHVIIGVIVVGGGVSSIINFLL